MEFCKYHPIEPAFYRCQNCEYECCRDCINSEDRTGLSRCFLCNQPLTPILNSDTITPFWRRLSESFKYPMNTDSLMLIFGAAVLFTLTSYLPFSLIFQLLILGGLIKYSFTCLENTAKGELTAPDITQAYGSGFKLVLQVIFLNIAVFLVIGAAYEYLGSMIGSMIAVILIAGLPAMTINFALTENIFDALNPLSMFRLMSSIGLPYGLILAFILIMTGSVGVINQFLMSDDISLISIILQSSVSNYYMVVIFHIMGYMIYQYQEELGFETQLPGNFLEKRKSVVENGLTHIDILIKEGRYDEAVNIFKNLSESYPDDENLIQNFFELLLATRDKETIHSISEKYFNSLINKGIDDKVSIAFQRISSVIDGFKPLTAEQRYQVAKIFHNKGNYKQSVFLINGIHKDFPKHSILGTAFVLMADSLDNMPNMQSQAQKCRDFSKKLELSQSQIG